MAFTPVDQSKFLDGARQQAKAAAFEAAEELACKRKVPSTRGPGGWPGDRPRGPKRPGLFQRRP